MEPAHAGLIAGLSVAAFSAANSLIVRWIGARIPPITLNAWRCTVAALIFLPLWWSSSGVVPGAHALLWIGLSVLFSIVIGDTSFFLAIKKIGVSKAMPIAKTYPVFTVLLSRLLLNESLSVLKMLGVALAVGGTALMSRRAPSATDGTTTIEEDVRKSAREHRNGFLIAIGTAVAWAVGAVILRVSLTTADVVTVSFFKTVIAGVLLATLSARVDHVPVQAVLLDRTKLLLAGATGITLAGAALLLVYSTSLVGAGAAAVYSGLAPLFAVPLGVLIFKERMSIPAAVGCALAIGGIICVSMG